MPKMKTNRSAYKKFRVNAKGKFRHSRSNRSHNTAKRAPKRMRQLRGLEELTFTHVRAVKRMLPYACK